MNDTQPQPQPAIAIEDLCELETRVAIFGAAHQVDATGHMCFSVGVALGVYSAAG